MNIAGYRFADLMTVMNSRRCFAVCVLIWASKVLLAPRVPLAGISSSIEAFTQALENDKRFTDILKVSYTDYQPFNRMNVRKNEIISVGLDHIRPVDFTGEEIEPQAFKAMLDAGELFTY